MLKLTVKAVQVTCLLIGAGVAVAALSSRQSPAPAADSLCRAGSQWLSVGANPPQPSSIRDVVAHAVRQDVVLLGEQHDNEDHHRWQLQMLAALHAQRPQMVIGFEMFPRRVQPVLDEWVAGRLTVQQFLRKVEWDQTWSYPPQIYMPLFEFARLNGIPMRALNVDKKLARMVAEKGWAGVPEDAREGIGRPAPASPDYMAFLRGVYQAHVDQSAGRSQAKGGSSDTGFRNFVDSQLTWDRAMAEALAREVRPTGQLDPALVVGIMGSGHIRFGHGVPHQLAALGVERVASLLPVALDDECRQLAPGFATAVFTLPDKAMPPREPPRLGVTLEDGAGGPRVTAVTAGSLAEETGLRVGDRIVEMAGRPVADSGEAIAVIRRQPPGTWLPMRLTRGDSPLDLVVRFPPRP